MELRKIASRKSVKFLTLLLTAMLIATASAAIYYSMYMGTSATITQAKVIFEEGADGSGVVSMGANSTSVSLAINAYPNITLTYDEPLNISNIDGSPHNVKLTYSSISPANGSSSVSNFTFICFTLINKAGGTVTGGTLNYTTSGDNWILPTAMDYQPLPNGEDWRVKIQTRATAGATALLTATIVMYVDVQE